MKGFATNRRAATTAAALAAVTVLGAGCSGGSGQHPAAPAKRSTPGTAAAVANDPVAPLKVANSVAERKNVLLATCQGSASGWQAAGTAGNTTGTAKRYHVTVFFTTEHATVVASRATDVSVPAHGSADWTVSTTVKHKAGLRCVLRGVAVVH